MTITIHYDPYCKSPREWDNLGTILASHKRYELSDEPFPEAGEYGSLEADFSRHLQSNGLSLDKVIYTPIYMYDHSGITLSPTPFSCPWDSGQIGFNYVSRAKVRTEYAIKRISRALEEKVIEVLNDELQTYNNYVKGNCYGFIITDDEDNHIDSCWGFIGDDFDDIKKQMMEYIKPEYWNLLNNIDYKDIKH